MVWNIYVFKYIIAICYEKKYRRKILVLMDINQNKLKRDLYMLMFGMPLITINILVLNKLNKFLIILIHIHYINIHMFMKKL